MGLRQVATPKQTPALGPETAKFCVWNYSCALRTVSLSLNCLYVQHEHGIGLLFPIGSRRPDDGLELEACRRGSI